MELFNPDNLKFDFVRFFKPIGLTTALLCVVSLIAIVKPGFNYGIDFRGGIEAHVNFKKPIDQKELRDALAPKIENVSIVNFADQQAAAGGSQSVGSDFLVTAQAESKEGISNTLKAELTSKYGPEGDAWTVQKMDLVGPKVGAELRKSALLSLLYSCLLITLYMYWRFDLRYSPGALACIFHDLFLASGFIVATRMEFSMTLVAALLTLSGYSINDTVVVFDRIREYEHKFLGRPKKDLVNAALNSTLSRTLITSGMTMLACLVLYFVGGPAIRDFAAVLFFGIVVGTYSSAFVAAPLYIWADKRFGEHDLKTKTA